MRMLLPSRPYERSRTVATPAITIATIATMMVAIDLGTNSKLGLTAK